MKVFTDIYNYSKEKSVSMFQKKEPVVVEKKKESTWTKCCEKYGEVQNSSCKYIMHVCDTIKNMTQNIRGSFSFFKFNTNYLHIKFSGFNELFLSIKEKIYKLLQITHKEASAVSNIDVKKEEKQYTRKSLKNIFSNSTDEGIIKKHHLSNAFNGIVSLRNTKKLKRTNSECINDKRNSNVDNTIVAESYSLFSKSHTLTLMNKIIPFHNKIIKDETEKSDNVHVVEVIDTDENEKLMNIPILSTGEISNSSKHTANKEETDLISDIKTLNFQGALKKFNKFLL